MGTTSRKKIGFINYDGDVIEENTQEIVKKGNEEGTISISEAQADLIETINGLAEIIVSSSFSSYTEEVRARFVKNLMNSVALNAELTTKTILIIG